MERQRYDIGTHRLLSEILARYGSIDAFCAYLHYLLDDPTIELAPLPYLPVPATSDPPPPARG
ncbi:hypothetical protein [Nocardia goodfellowii]|uniref:Uncharacterized protein n=1 Tax=Nocardia goodfellowii TaxID=882446 RepID=A0ABS4QG82_9NOCA|nr:hypothetical protein [Nocardia goodfellowii]MBP2190160.1 hypothetical protein [Nocardia goodfellowii]